VVHRKHSPTVDDESPGVRWCPVGYHTQAIGLAQFVHLFGV